MESNPLVTVGILSYNRPTELKRAIQSVLGQTYNNIEIIVSDNGSDSDLLRDIIKSFAVKDSRFKYHFHEVNKGPLFNFGFLVSEAKGKYFVWLADDDYFEANYIADCVSYFRLNPGAIATSNQPIDGDTKNILNIKYPPHTIGLSATDKYQLMIRHIFNDINIFYYSVIDITALRECKLYLKKIFGSDVLLMFELLNFGDIYINNKRNGVAYTVHPTQTSNSPSRYKKVLTINSSFFERTFFFSAIFYYLPIIIMSSSILNLAGKVRVLKTMFYYFYKSKRYHLIKYDLRINRIIQFLKSHKNNITT